MVEPALTPEEWAEAAPLIEALRSGPRALSTAALCLHGRITWEMVDALREAEPDYRSDIVAQGAALNAAADLLESLLPPRDVVK